MLAFSRKTDYALIALTHLARQSDDTHSAREIANRYGVPLPLLMNILKSLAQNGLTQSTRGPRGGYSLGRPASQINLHDIITAVDGPVQLVQCVDWYDHKQRGKVKSGCEIMGKCPARPTVHLIHDRLVKFLEDVTLADVVQNAPEPCGQHEAEAVPAGSGLGDTYHEISNLPR
jgi:Rrf2 family protein